MPVIISGNSGTLTVDGSNGITFPYGSNAQEAPSKVLQVVNGLSSTTYSTTSTTPVTALSATITPLFSTSKILVLVATNVDKTVGNTYGRLNLTRAGSVLLIWNDIASWTNSTSENNAGYSFNYLDSPATTSSTTYALQFSNGLGTGTIYINNAYSVPTYSSIILMEIAQ